MLNIASLYARRAELAFLAGPTFTGPHPDEYNAIQLAIKQAELQSRLEDELPMLQGVPLTLAPQQFDDDTPARYCQMCGIPGRRVVPGTHRCGICTLAVRNGVEGR